MCTHLSGDFVLRRPLEEILPAFWDRHRSSASSLWAWHRLQLAFQLSIHSNQFCNLERRRQHYHRSQTIIARIKWCSTNVNFKHWNLMGRTANFDLKALKNLHDCHWPASTWSTTTQWISWRLSISFKRFKRIRILRTRLANCLAWANEAVLSLKTTFANQNI